MTGGWIRAALLACAPLWAAAAAGPASGQEPEDAVVYRHEALAHARAAATAWRRLESWILSGAAGIPGADPDTTVSGWSGAIPPAAGGWLAGWTERGLRARYCADTLLVYLAPERLKGVGRDHRAVQAAPHAHAGGETRDRAPVLHWLEGDTAVGGLGRPSVALPACLSDAARGGALPSGRAAIAGSVPDPYAQAGERVTRERRVEACAAGEHGAGRTQVREVVQALDGLGDPVGDPAPGPWEVLIDACRADYEAWEHYTLSCSWEAGPPHVREVEGREIWRRRKTVTAAGEVLGPPEFVSTSCRTAAVPAPPEATVTETSSTQTKTGACPPGHVGSLGYRRISTRRATQFPWDAAPVVRTAHGPWVLATDNCRTAVRPTWDDDGDHGHGGGEDAGSAGAGGDTCDAGAGGGGAGDDGCGGGDGGDGGGCFLTTAVVERRGVEADDGPTLTALRGFRDGYMMRTPARRALVAEYYALAPGIAAAIPRDHREWDWIAARIDAAAAAIGSGDADAAFAIYVGMMRRLVARWGPEADAGSAPAGEGA